jgi:hypothetical protein
MQYFYLGSLPLLIISISAFCKVSSLVKSQIRIRQRGNQYLTNKMSNFKAKDSLAEMEGKGAFVRTASVFRETISLEHPKYQPEFNRYHLYISLACPWANRCLIVLKLKGMKCILCMNSYS